MKNTEEMITERFVFNPNRSLLIDTTTTNEIKLEPRLGNLLSLLCDNRGKLVTREDIIDKIWNNYGGAEDGLNQAISYLRKVLLDKDKKIIETIPKKGYVLNMLVLKDQETRHKQHQSIFKKLGIKGYAAIFVSIILAGVIFLKKDKSSSVTTKNSPVEFSTDVNYNELNKPEAETFLNTITTVSPDNTTYKVIAIGDKRPTFYINNKLVKNQEDYTVLIDNMLKQLWERQKKYYDSIGGINK
ncbi:winged helix-turn-helix domain-containing protein [Confluentibacter lentus]|uniref:winged helix-turn-helix domain-containing protein n=1 Tax=Confluentibacter lentus TaxID=1699412 RepID=UPI000C282F32|nr:winged helix-turn-helix domain-containing protein [Confluentibacter lentus]